MSRLEDLKSRFADFDSDTSDETLDSTAAEIRAVGEEGLSAILEALATEFDPRKRRALIFGLTAEPIIQRGWIYELLLSELDSSSDLVLAETIFALRLLQRDLCGLLMARFWNNPSEYVRARVLEMIVGRRTEAEIYLEKGLRDPSFIVRESAIDLIDEHGLEGWRRRLEELLSDPHEHVRQAARNALENMAVYGG